jgi:hypothetical protein
VGFLAGLYNTGCITHDSNQYYKYIGRVLYTDKMPFLNSRRVIQDTISCNNHVYGSTIQTYSTTYTGFLTSHMSSTLVYEELCWKCKRRVLIHGSNAVRCMEKNLTFQKMMCCMSVVYIATQALAPQIPFPWTNSIFLCPPLENNISNFLRNPTISFLAHRNCISPRCPS